MIFKSKYNNCASVVCATLLLFCCVFHGVGKCDLLIPTESLFGDMEMLSFAGADSTTSETTASHYVSAANNKNSAVITSASFSAKRLYDILKRGKDLLKFLPRLGIIVAGKFLDFIPTPSEILNFGKQTLMGLPQEVIAYAIDSVCRFILI